MRHQDDPDRRLSDSANFDNDLSHTLTDALTRVDEAGRDPIARPSKRDRAVEAVAAALTNGEIGAVERAWEGSRASARGWRSLAVLFSAGARSSRTEASDIVDWLALEEICGGGSKKDGIGAVWENARRLTAHFHDIAQAGSDRLFGDVLDRLEAGFWHKETGGGLLEALARDTGCTERAERFLSRALAVLPVGGQVNSALIFSRFPAQLPALMDAMDRHRARSREAIAQELMTGMINLGAFGSMPEADFKDRIGRLVEAGGCLNGRNESGNLLQSILAGAVTGTANGVNMARCLLSMGADPSMAMANGGLLLALPRNSAVYRMILDAAIDGGRGPSVSDATAALTALVLRSHVDGLMGDDTDNVLALLAAGADGSGRFSVHGVNHTLISQLAVLQHEDGGIWTRIKSGVGGDAAMVRLIQGLMAGGAKLDAENGLALRAAAARNMGGLVAGLVMAGADIRVALKGASNDDAFGGPAVARKLETVQAIMSRTRGARRAKKP